MKCEQVQELFPELSERSGRFPEAEQHLQTCSNCKTLFHIFEGLSDDRPIMIDPVKRDANFIHIKKKLRHHDRVVFTRRISSVAAVFLLMVVTFFNIDQTNTISIADISDDVLYLQAESDMVPEISMDQNEIIEYLAQYENIETLGNLF